MESIFSFFFRGPPEDFQENKPGIITVLSCGSKLCEVTVVVVIPAPGRMVFERTPFLNGTHYHPFLAPLPKVAR